jgi:hypothetical protein
MTYDARAHERSMGKMSGADRRVQDYDRSMKSNPSDGSDSGAPPDLSSCAARINRPGPGGAKPN